MPPEIDDIDKASQDQYNAAFDELAPQAQAQSDDEAFGITPPAEAVAAAEAESGASGDAGAEAVEADAEAEPEAAIPATDPVQNADTEESEPELPADPKEAQRIKSWEGRLRKMEADLKAKAGSTEQAAAEALESTGEQAEAGGNAALAESAEAVAEQVEAGTLSVSAAMKQLTEDFGEDFVKMIEAIAAAKAGEIGGQAVGSIKGEVDSIASHIKNADERAHFQAIERACPEFNDVRQNPEFKTFIQGGDAERQRIAGGGNADEVIKLVQAFKASQAPAPVAEKAAPARQEVDPQAADAAAGVRSGMRLPAEPTRSDDYEGAWEEAAKS